MVQSRIPFIYHGVPFNQKYESQNNDLMDKASTYITYLLICALQTNGEVEPNQTKILWKKILGWTSTARAIIEALSIERGRIVDAGIMTIRTLQEQSWDSFRRESDRC
jgi:hypothetical protein